VPHGDRSKEIALMWKEEKPLNEIIKRSTAKPDKGLGSSVGTRKPKNVDTSNSKKLTH
jgi:hypothetical protein